MPLELDMLDQIYSIVRQVGQSETRDKVYSMLELSESFSKKTSTNFLISALLQEEFAFGNHQ